ncbi:hypothetical protein OG21DRAFT_1523768 [Imleria badia]|nr:hypothetical protein OG21DRAFT_1523768 [Imleria badia]
MDRKNGVPTRYLSEADVLLPERPKALELFTNETTLIGMKACNPEVKWYGDWAVFQQDGSPPMITTCSVCPMICSRMGLCSPQSASKDAIPFVLGISLWSANCGDHHRTNTPFVAKLTSRLGRSTIPAGNILWEGQDTRWLFNEPTYIIPFPEAHNSREFLEALMARHEQMQRTLGCGGQCSATIRPVAAASEEITVSRPFRLTSLLREPMTHSTQASDRNRYIGRRTIGLARIESTSASHGITHKRVTDRTRFAAGMPMLGKEDEDGVDALSLDERIVKLQAGAASGTTYSF